jgi:hypothetical protein
LLGKDEFERQKAEALQERNQRLLDAELAIQDEQAKKEALAAIEQEYQNQLTAIDKDAKDKADATQKAAFDKEKADAKALFDIKVGLVSSGFNILQELAGKNEKAQKGIAAAQATFDTYAAIVGTLRAAQTSPGAAIPGYAIAQAVATGVFGMLQVKKILSTKTGSTSTPTVSSGAGGGGARPSVETPRIPNFNAQNQGVGGRDGFGSVRAVVIQQDIKDSASLDNRVDDLIKIGK